MIFVCALAFCQWSVGYIWAFWCLFLRSSSLSWKPWLVIVLCDFLSSCLSTGQSVCATISSSRISLVETTCFKQICPEHSVLKYLSWIISSSLKGVLHWMVKIQSSGKLILLIAEVHTCHVYFLEKGLNTCISHFPSFRAEWMPCSCNLTLSTLGSFGHQNIRKMESDQKKIERWGKAWRGHTRNGCV